MTQLALAFPPSSPLLDDRVPTFMAETNATLLVIASQRRRRARGRRQALNVLRWRAATATKGGRFGRPTRAQVEQMERLAVEVAS